MVKKGSPDGTAKKKKLFLIIFEEKAGNVSKACKGANMGRRTYYNWMESDKKFAGAVEDINESLIDWGEDALKTRIGAGDTIATIFFLKTKGRSRGYIEKHEVDIPNGIKLIISNQYLPKRGK